MELVTKSLEQLKSQSGNEGSTLGQPRLEALPTVERTGWRKGSNKRTTQEGELLRTRKGNRAMVGRQGAGPWKKGLSGRS